MPRTGYIYEIKSNDKSITGLYIGSTWDMAKRIIDHSSSCYNEKYHGYNLPVYKYIRENGGFHTFNMKVIDSGECQDLTELECGEQFYIDMAGGIDNLLNDRDAQQDKQKRKEKNFTALKNVIKKNKETKRFQCELCGSCFQSNNAREIHYTSKIHITKVKNEPRTLE